MESGTLAGIFTAILMVAFLSIVGWAYSKKRRKDFDEAARRPLERDGEDR